MDRSLGTPAQPRIQDVTPQINRTHQIYGASDNTNPAYASADKSLNYASGGSIQSPELDRVTIIPYTINYKDTVGLFGKENHFVKVNVNINTDMRLLALKSQAGNVQRLLQQTLKCLTLTSQVLLITIKI